MRIQRLFELSGGHTKTVRSVLWSPDGETLASCGDDRSVCLWDAKLGVLKQTLSGHRSSVVDLAFDATGNLASAGRDPAIILWDARTGAVHRRLAGFSPFTRLTWLHGECLLGGNELGQITRWALEEDKPIHLQSHAAAITSLQVVERAGATVVVTASRDNCVKVWEAATLRLLDTFEPQFSCHGAVVTASADRIVLYGRSTEARVHKFPCFEPVVALKVESEITSVAVSDRSDQLAVMDSKSETRLWNLGSPKQSERIRSVSIKSFSQALSFHPDAARLAARGGDKCSVAIHDLHSTAQRSASAVDREPENEQPVSGSTRYEFQKRLSASWHGLATVLEIPDHERATWPQGHEASGIWAWLEARDRLNELGEALGKIERGDLARLFG